MLCLLTLGALSLGLSSSALALPMQSLLDDNIDEDGLDGVPGGADEAACDLRSCQCDGVSLAALRGKVITTPPNDAGYSYQISFCSNTPREQLPHGCQRVGEDGAVAKYRADDPSDCMIVGSTGPCKGETCGVTGKKTPTGVDVHFFYQYGAIYDFLIHLEHGASSSGGPGPGPGPVAQAEEHSLSYESTWVGAPITDAAHYRCVRDACVETPADLPGLDATTCQETCGALKGCLPALYRKCDGSRQQADGRGADACNFCTGEHHIELALAGCTAVDYRRFCDRSPPPAPAVAGLCASRPTVGDHVRVHSVDPSIDKYDYAAKSSYIGRDAVVYTDDGTSYQLVFSGGGIPDIYEDEPFTWSELWCLSRPQRDEEGTV
eukprot:COSAG01_NODE_3484_length_6019_cov_13.268750_2_plen_378_part_00